MSNKTNLLDTVKRIKTLESSLSQLNEWYDEATYVFMPHCSLKEMEKSFEKYWAKLITFELHCSTVPWYIDTQSYAEVKNAFYDIKNANIDRKTFKETLKPTCDGIEAYIKEVEKALTKESENLGKLYDKFASTSGEEFEFIFKEPRIKAIIISKLLKS